MRHISAFFLVLSIVGTLRAQKRDSTDQQSLARRAFIMGMNMITTNPGDTIGGSRSEDEFQAYGGKIIRRIKITHIGFEKSLYDSSRRVAKTVTNIANSLHVDTREKTIRQHLFFKVNNALNPYTLADNERFLRDKDFILDSRIFVSPVEGTDSVDVTVLVRDVFSLGARADGSLAAPEFGFYDANLSGRAQRLELNVLIDPDRSPTVGYSLFYRKSSFLGSLANLELGYSQLSDGQTLGDEAEYSVFARLDRPLVSANARLAGAIVVNYNSSRNVYTKPDSVFLDYAYWRTDVWAGYNLGIRRAPDNRFRQFLAVRMFNGYYIQPADVAETSDEINYNDAFGVLSEFTVYKREFYKTRYVYGFGRTEDVPTGISFSVATGYLRLISLERPYGSLKLNAASATSRGNFYLTDLQVGGFVRDNSVEDMVVMAKAAYYTRLLKLDRYNLRNQFSITYTQLFNHHIINWLAVTGSQIPGFATDSLKADRRWGFHLESALFTPWSLLGFRFAPFTAIDMVPVRCLSCDDSYPVFWGFSLGLRSRNENLIFGTLEAKFTVIPKNQYGQPEFKFSFKQNLRIKNTGTFVKAPSLIAYN